MNKTILKYVLKNILDFGSVNPKAVLGAVLRENPELKKDVPGTLKEIEVSAKNCKLNPEEAKQQLEKEFPEVFENTKEVVKGPLKELKNAVKGKLVVRIAPSPSGPLHIGHAYGCSLNYEYAKMYDGKLLLRIEDTNPENIYPDAYHLIEDDVNWLTDNGVAREVMLQSSRLGTYYDYAEKLINQEKAYVCTCNLDKFRELKSAGKACPCRSLDKQEQQTRYAKMFGEYAEGEAVMRLRTDIKHKNPAMRDFSLMRINEHVHPKTGKEQRVWPLMVFSVAVDDHETGVTHVLNGKEHADNSLKEGLVMQALGWTSPIDQHWGKINFQGFKLKTSITKLAVEQGEYKGWDDIRLPFLRALRRRGYQAGAFRKFAMEIGLSLNDKHVTMEEFWKNINAFNRELIEPLANRYFFVADPVKIKVLGAPGKKVEMALHADYPDRGNRKLKVNDTFFIANDDFKKLGESYVHRLIDCCNFKLEKKNFIFSSEKYEDYKQNKDKGKIIHWLPDDSLKVEVLMDDGSTIKGIGEAGLIKLKEGDIIQFERLFFVRIDQIQKDLIRAWYLHK